MKAADYLVASTGDLYLVRMETKFFRKAHRLATGATMELVRKGEENVLSLDEVERDLGLEDWAYGFSYQGFDEA